MTLDELAADIAARARHARDHNSGHPLGVWSTREQLAVALVLRDREHLAAMDFTVQQAGAVGARRHGRPAGGFQHLARRGTGPDMTHTDRAETDRTGTPNTAGGGS